MNAMGRALQEVFGGGRGNRIGTRRQGTWRAPAGRTWKRWWMIFAILFALLCAFPRGDSQKLDSSDHAATAATLSRWINPVRPPLSVQDVLPFRIDDLRPRSFDVSDLQQIPSAEPGARINLIEPPHPNSLGDARLSYPIEVPPGRYKLQPDLAVRYDSSKGNGWMGIGWNIAPSEIRIDTRWGVPRYDASKETETYSLDDEQLTPVAHRGSLRDRTSEQVFHTRVEGKFQQIVRHGNGPANYWWEVVQTNGTHRFYGGTPDGTALDPAAILADPATGNTFRWMLTGVRDAWGNTIQYSYSQVTDVGVAGGTVPGRQIYLKEIRYTGFGDTAGPYSVRFLRDRELPNFGSLKRPDVMINARSGFKMVTADRLKKIVIRYNGDLVRQYDFAYTLGAFRKTLLLSITQRGADGKVFNTHAFEYYDEVRNSLGQYVEFGPKETWDTGYDDVSWKLPALGQASAIGGETATEGGGDVYIGFNPGTPTKQDSAGGKVGYSHSSGGGILSLMDIDGDMLPDKVFEKSDAISFRRNRSGPEYPGDVKFESTPHSIPTLPLLSEENSDTMTFGAEAFPGPGSVLADYSHTIVKRPAYLNDVNGDGFPDLVRDGVVWFNHPDANGIPTFTLDSNDTPVPIGAGAVDATDLIDDFSDLYEQRIDTYPLEDSLRRWVAPYTGTIRISGSVQLIEDTSQARQDYKTADGVRVAIQQNGSELWGLRIEQDDYTMHYPIGVDAVHVFRGDRIYFRVQSILDGAYDQVAWDPNIQYLSTPSSARDANERNPYFFSASEDFTLAGRRSVTVTSFKGSVRLMGDLIKHGVTSDDIAVEVLRNDVTVATIPMAWNETGTLPVQADFDVEKSDNLQFIVRADSPIDVAKIEWVPELVYTAVEDGRPVTDPDGNYIIVLHPPYDIDLYPEHDSMTVQQPWVAPETGRIEVAPQLALPPPNPPFVLPFDSDLVITVKRRGELLGKRAIPIRDGRLPNLDDLRFQVDVTKDDALFFDYSTRDGRKSVSDDGLADKLIGYSCRVRYVSPGTTLFTTVPTDLHRSVLIVSEFPVPFRNWGYIGYNGNRDRANQPIDESLLVISDATNYNPSNANVYLAYPDPENGRWRASDESCWMAPDAMSSSRLGMDNIEVPRPSDFAGARAVTIMSTGDNFTVGAGAGVVAGSVGTGTSECDVDFLDMNGDLFPDVVGKRRIQYTTLTGGLEASNRSVPGMNPFRESDNFAANGGVGVSVGGNPAESKQSARGDLSPSRGRTASTSSGNSGGGEGGTEAGVSKGRRSSSASSGNKKGASGKEGSEKPELGFQGEVTYGTSDTDKDLVDINGDGLPDQVERDGSSLRVALNLGYKFAPVEVWSRPSIDASDSLGFNGAGSLGFNDGIYGFGGGGSLTMTWNSSDGTLLDMNGDGLVDWVVPGSGVFLVALNNGAGFDSPIVFYGGLNDEMAQEVNATVGGGAYFTIGIGPLCLAGCYIIINPGGFLNYSMSRPETSFIDLDGDGYLDQVNSDSDDSLDVALNRARRTNLLKKVIRPLGGTITLDYQRDGNTIDYPPSRWNLSRIETYDGHPGDGVDTLVTTCQYSTPIYEPNERESYGYRTVVEETRDSSRSDALCRSVTRTYGNTTYYNKGLLEGVSVEDAAGRKLVEATHQYVYLDIDTNAPVVPPNSTIATVFPELVRSDTNYYEGQNDAGKSTHVTYAYDEYGNLVDYVDVGDAGIEDDLHVTLDYYEDLNSYIVNRPNNIVVSGGGEELARSEADVEAGTGAIRQIRRILTDGRTAITDLDYDEYGNVISITGPPNLHDQRYAVSIEYDPETHSRVTSIEDSLGARSTRTYDPHLALPTALVDPNGNRIAYEYDEFGRLTSARGPYQRATDPPTLWFDYHPDAATPWATTNRIDSLREGNDPIKTVVFTDGLKRAVQTKTDAAVATDGADSPMDVMIVSGRVEFDCAGRIVARDYPTTEPLGSAGVFNPTPDTVPPTRMDYDALNRPIRRTRPSGAVETWAYGFGSDRDGVTEIETVATDPKGIQKREYRNVRDRIVAVREADRAEQEVHWTGYRYDALSRLIEIVDDRDNRTGISYDNLGRRVAIDSPDSGNTEDQFDLAGNRIRRITSKLRAAGMAIEYDYEFNRLTGIQYPIYPDHNVSYAYGRAGATDNSAGRIVRIESQAGTEEREYGKLGEILWDRKNIAGKTLGKSLHSPEVYTTEYGFDTWGRRTRLVYPDGEVLTYGYDSGGSLASLSGEKRGFTWNYVPRLLYDKFRKPAVVEFGNGLASRYAYDPITRRLSTLRTGADPDSPLQDLRYFYDPAGTIVSIMNEVSIPPANLFGGPMLQVFAYDDFYRLTAARGSYFYAPDKTDRYELSITYDSIHNTTQKTQLSETVQPGGRSVPDHETTYDWLYQYPGGHPHAPSHIGDRTYLSDDNGNQSGWRDDQNGTRRDIVRDEENRIRSISSNGRTARYVYDAAGERVIKRGPQGETVYVNPFYSIRNGSVATKHVFAGACRVATKLSPANSGKGSSKGVPELNFTYYLHPNHLGSSLFVTDNLGRPFQHFEYFPFGETWVEEKTNTQRTPYQFIARELDEDTGLYYSGRRYYDPKTDLWLSGGVAMEALLSEREGRGVLDPRNLAIYSFRRQNPLQFGLDTDRGFPGTVFP